MSEYTNNAYPAANEQELNDGLYMIETEDRLETVQAIDAIDLSCCGDS